MSKHMHTDELGRMFIDPRVCDRQAAMLERERTITDSLEHGIDVHLTYIWDGIDNKVEPLALYIGSQRVQLGSFLPLLAHLVALAFAEEWDPRA